MRTKEQVRQAKRESYARRSAAEVEKCRLRRESNRNAHRARYMVTSAIKTGDLWQKECTVCGGVVRLEAHHCDYGRPLDVTWLCRLHHRRWHMKNEPLQGEIKKPYDLRSIRLRRSALIYSKIDQYRAENDLSWRKMEKIIGVCAQNMMRWNGLSPISEKSKEKALIFLGMTYQDIVLEDLNSTAAIRRENDGRSRKKSGV